MKIQTLSKIINNELDILSIKRFKHNIPYYHLRIQSFGITYQMHLIPNSIRKMLQNNFIK